MKKIMKWIGLCLFIWGMFLGASVLRDKGTLSEGIVRLHVVANSDSESDQQAKLVVRDAVTAYLNEALAGLEDMEQVKQYLQSHLDQLEAIARQTLEQLGISDGVVVSFEKEAFPVRRYDTFSLPSGVYQSLRVRIGQAQGHNWWCVVFPTLCLPESEDEFTDVAAGAGFSDSLSHTLRGDEEYEIRFFLLDLIGWLENKLTAG